MKYAACLLLIALGCTADTAPLADRIDALSAEIDTHKREQVAVNKRLQDALHKLEAKQLAPAPAAAAQRVAVVPTPKPASQGAVQTYSGRVAGIIDGDTISIRDSERATYTVRLVGIDAPEKGQPQATESRQALLKKVFGKDVSVRWRSRDGSGNLLGSVWLDGRNVNHDMIREGWAWYDVKALKSSAMQTLEAEAREKSLGLWIAPNPVAPWLWKQEQEAKALASAREAENRPRSLAGASRLLEPPPREQEAITVYITRTGAKYHRAGCRSLSKSMIPISLEEVRASYGACKICNPP